jgi:protein-tyrosine phosphatase
MISVMFVCLGNICRSPAGEGMLKDMAKKRGVTLHIESSGIGDWHQGEPPDFRIREAARRHGIELESRGQVFKPEFFSQYDYILAADESIYDALCSHAGAKEDKDKIHFMTAFSPLYKGKDVPDPYYGGKDGFEEVLTILEDSCKGLLDVIEKR